MKKSVFLLVFICMLVSLGAASVEEIKSNSSYLWGEGRAKAKDAADRIALKELLSQISVKVESSYIDILEENNGEVTEECQLKVKTYSSVKLYNTERIVDEESYQPDVYVLRYIKRSVVDNVFRERKARVNSLILEGEIAENKGKIADALRNYYWAFALLPTIPDYKQISYCFGGEEAKNCYTGLENKLNSILNGISFAVEEKQADDKSNYVDYLVRAEFEGKPVSPLLLSYNDGYADSEVAKWSNGRGRIRLDKSIAETSTEIKIKIDYSYRGHAYDEDVIKAIDEMSYKRLAASEKILYLCKEQPVLMSGLEIEINNSINISSKRCKKIGETVQKIAETINNKQFGLARKFFTLEGYSDFNKLIEYGNAEFTDRSFDLEMVDIADKITVRGLPLVFQFSGNKERFNEKVNLTFSEKGKVEKITFALSDSSIEGICSNQRLSEAEQAQVVNFMELYKTAYCLQELEFLEKVFADDALIIVGTVVEEDPEYDVEGLIKQLGDEKVKYIKYEKADFIERLAGQFDEKDFINLQFSDTSLKSLGNSGQHIYGIQIEQYYYSDNYADNGYLFLMFNLNEPDKPRITVRSWQPEKFEDGSIIGLENFRF